MELTLRPDEAQLLASIGVSWIEREWETTRKVISAIPLNRMEYRPDPKARNAMELAWHLACSEAWFLEGILRGEFDIDEPKQPDEVKTPADVITWYEQNLPRILKQIRALSPERLASKLSFFGMFNYPTAIYLNFAISHTIHHRGQLSTYLRPMGAKVPSIYGGSADEPFEMPVA